MRRLELDAIISLFKFRHPFEMDLLRKYVRPLVDFNLVLRVDTDLPRVGVLEDLESGTVDAIELHRCSEVIIYGITASHASSVGGVDGSVELWPSES